MATCYRHPDRETGVSCSNCGRPICPDCMTPTPVGMRCPECSRERTPVRTLRSLERDPDVTRALIGVNAVAYLATIFTGDGNGVMSEVSGSVFANGAIFGPAIADGEVWRVISGGFLHANLIHIGFNMYLLWLLGQMLEPTLGRWRFGALYMTALVGGSLGAVLLSNDKFTVGASGAIFGLMGAAFIGLRARGINPMETGIGGLLVLNLLITFAFGASGGISIGGHLGGLAAGAAAGWLLMVAGERPERRRQALAATVALGLVLFAVTVVIAEPLTLTL